MYMAHACCVAAVLKDCVFFCLGVLHVMGVVFLYVL